MCRKFSNGDVFQWSVDLTKSVRVDRFVRCLEGRCNSVYLTQSTYIRWSARCSHELLQFFHKIQWYTRYLLFMIVIFLNSNVEELSLLSWRFFCRQILVILLIIRYWVTKSLSAYNTILNYRCNSCVPSMDSLRDVVSEGGGKRIVRRKCRFFLDQVV